MAYILEGDPILDALAREWEQRRRAAIPPPVVAREHPVSVPRPPSRQHPARPLPPVVEPPPDEFDEPEDPYEDPYEVEPPGQVAPPPPVPQLPFPLPEIPQGPIGGPPMDADVVKHPTRVGSLERALAAASPVRLAPFGLSRRRSSRGARPRFPRQRTFRTGYYER